MTGRAIVTFARSWYTVSAIRSLGRRGIEVIAGDEFPLTPGSLSRYTRAAFRYPNHVEDPDGFLAAVSRAVAEHAPDDPDTPYVLMPMHRESYLIAAHRDRFEGAIALPLPSSEGIERVRHKARLAALAREVGVATPRTWQPGDRGALAALAGEIDYPVFVKVPAGAAGLGVEKVEDRTELLETYARLVREHHLVGEDRPLVQEAAPGDDYCTTLILVDGRPHAAMTYRNALSFPADGGPGAVRETVAAPRAEEIAGRLLGSLGWHGVAQVDFRWTGDDADEPLLIEINPRFFGGLSHAIASGVDYPWYLYQLGAHGCIAEHPEPEEGTRTETPVVGMLATLQELIASDRSSDTLSEAWHRARIAMRRGEPLYETVIRLARNVRDAVTVEDRIEHVRRVLDENRDNVSSLIDSDDPLPALGLTYPLLAFLQRGSVDPGILSGVDT